MMKIDGVRPTEKFYMALLRATGEGGRTDKTLDILEEMKSIGLKPGVRSYNCAIGACGKVNRLLYCLSAKLKLHKWPRPECSK